MVLRSLNGQRFLNYRNNLMYRTATKIAQLEARVNKYGYVQRRAEAMLAFLIRSLEQDF